MFTEASQPHRVIRTITLSHAYSPLIRPHLSHPPTHYHTHTHTLRKRIKARRPSLTPSLTPSSCAHLCRCVACESLSRTSGTLARLSHSQAHMHHSHESESESDACEKRCGRRSARRASGTPDRCSRYVRATPVSRTPFRPSSRHTCIHSHARIKRHAHTQTCTHTHGHGHGNGQGYNASVTSLDLLTQILT